MEPLEKIGFYTLSDERAKNSTEKSSLARCELIVNGECNFNCPYCRKVSPFKTSKEEAFSIVEKWASNGLKAIRFSGGEPTLWPHLCELVEKSKAFGIERIAISTNGSSKAGVYRDLLSAGANDFSVSLDACCSSVASAMSGIDLRLETVIENIKMLSSHTYVTLGVVITDTNKREVSEIVKKAYEWGVSDVRLIPAAQTGKSLEDVSTTEAIRSKFPILNYRLKSETVRGLSETDCRKCGLVLDDMAVMNGKHYPCIIYMRERGEAIGNTSGTIEEIRKERLAWSKEHNCFNDPICRGNCLDVCRDYNNKWMLEKIKKVTFQKIDSSYFNFGHWRNDGLLDIAIRFESLNANKGMLKQYAVGWCWGEDTVCRPKQNHIAVMFFKDDRHFWFHMRRNEFFTVFFQESQ